MDQTAARKNTGQVRPLAIAAASLAMALVSFFWFPGHTWLQQDSQIYVPILEHLRDPSLLRNDILVQHPHVGFTLYDEAAIGLRHVTGLGFREVLAAQQIVTRALGIWGLWALALALGLTEATAALVAAICALGAMITGPQVLTFEYEPTPRAFAVPLLMCAMGLAAQRRYTFAAVAGALAFLYHPLTALPFWIVFLAILAIRRKPHAAIPLAVAGAILWIAARFQDGGAPIMLGRIGVLEEQVERLRAAYVWISTWPATAIISYLIVAAILFTAAHRQRKALSLELRFFLIGLPILGLVSMPVSWLLLDHWRWALMPQVQPMRTLLFVTLAMQILATAAAVYAWRSSQYAEAALWLAGAMLPMFPHVAPQHAGSPELTQLSGWARTGTPRDAVFLFPNAGRSLESGIFRSEGLRAVYVDWKAGGQMNYIPGFAEEWWFRWQQTIAAGFHPADLAKYDGLGIGYVVLPPKDRLPRPAAFENQRFIVYAIR